ncbi:MAG: maleylpyruvate isomerase family mycothiol-dependent enzyme [Marmoricola sp.]
MLSLDEQLTAITTHSKGLAAAAERDLTAAVEHCPGWDIAELVRHVTEVHWLWGTIAAERLDAPPDESRRPVPPADDRLIEEFLAGAERMVGVLRDADQTASVWTWYPPRRDIGFISRHQVQEAVVHRWDAAHAAGADWSVDPATAADCVEEFLTTSLADADDLARLGAALPGELTLAATDTGQHWTVAQEPSAGLVWRAGGATPMVEGTAAQILLWIYQRVELPVSAGHEDAVAVFRRLSGTD